jgi:flagellar FliJ protein
MTKSKRFEPIREIAGASADEASRVMSEAGNRVAELEKQLDQLKVYREDYVRNLLPDAGAIDVLKLQNYRTFLDRLGDALRQHEHALQSARAEFERRRAQWSEKKIEAESLSRAVDRFRSDERRVQEQREQREGDDIALRVSRATPRE